MSLPTQHSYDDCGTDACPACRERHSSLSKKPMSADELAEEFLNVYDDTRPAWEARLTKLGKKYGLENRNGSVLAAMFRAYAASEGATQQWVSVEERLPDRNAQFLVQRSNNCPRFDLEYYQVGDQWNRGFFSDGEQDTNVTHWFDPALLPSPPKG